MQFSTAERLGLLKKLVESDGISGEEDEVREVIRAEVKGLCDEIKVDSFGNLVAIKKKSKSSVPRIMLASHMDEVGLIVKHIRSDGYLNFELSGFVDPSFLPSQWVRIHTAKGVVSGVVGAKPGHLADEDRTKPTHRSMWIDVGAESKEKALELGIRVGDSVTYDRPFRMSSNQEYVFGKALDNRVGCLLLIESMREILSVDCPCHLYGVGTVMEEVGALGAKVAANNLRPDLAIVLDGLPASDPSVPSEQSAVQVGKGPAIRRSEVHIPDSNVTPRWLFDLALRVADEEAIPYQTDVMSISFSDASAINISAHGIPTIAILVPRRNSHSPAEVASIRDIHHAIKLTAGLVKKISSMDLQTKHSF